MFPTGLDGLDEHLGGGIPPGNIVVLTAPPDSQSELMLYQFAAATDTRYLSTFRPADEIEEVVASQFPEADIPVERVLDETLLEDPGGQFDGLDGHGVVIDTATELERAGREQYRRSLDVLKRRLRATDSVALLHCLDVEPSPMRRGLTLGRADIVWRLRFAGLPDRVDPRLLVTKFRGGTTPRTALPLRFGDRVRVADGPDGGDTDSLPPEAESTDLRVDDSRDQ